VQIRNRKIEIRLGIREKGVGGAERESAGRVPRNQRKIKIKESMSLLIT
jgi:hypothetical protein